jgi:hypothetical protein
MALLLIIPSWILVLSLVVALCAAARDGDRQEERRAMADDWTQPRAQSQIVITRRLPRPDQAQQKVAARASVG